MELHRAVRNTQDLIWEQEMDMMQQPVGEAESQRWFPGRGKRAHE